MISRVLYRSWFYFRMGYGTYLSLAIGVFSNIIVIYKLALSSDPFLLSLFPHLLYFIALSIPLGSVLAIGAGYLHMKHSGAFKADVAVSVEANQYNWLAIPGKERELSIPVAIINLKCQLMIMAKLQILTPELENGMTRYLNILERLGKGEKMESP